MPRSRTAISALGEEMEKKNYRGGVAERLER